MSQMSWTSLLNAGTNSQLNSGLALTSSTSLTDITAGAAGAGQAFTIPANWFQVGQQYRVRANGIISTAGTPNLTIGVYLGGTAGLALCSVTAAAAASASAAPWILTADFRVESVGTSGSIRALGTVVGTHNAGTVVLPATSGTGNLVTVDTSATKMLTVGAQWGVNSASNSIQLMQYLVELLN